uniref:LRRG00121 n=1 Tax=Rattus norvegicus TaxID=10116 RepID=Q6QI87_RAT|nr:LRRG00121 [Rattus norvegicus]|eukprot:NP_001041403.1 uncharacterized protein LOC499219 [Rattus norvegicus]
MLTRTRYRSLLRDTARICQIQRRMIAVNYLTENGNPLGGIRERTDRAEGACNTIRTTMSTNQSFQELNHYPKTIHGLTHYSTCICSREEPCWGTSGRGSPWSCQAGHQHEGEAGRPRATTLREEQIAAARDMYREVRNAGASS